MPGDEPRETMRRFYEEVVSTGDVDRIAEFIAPECVEVDGEHRVESGIEGMADHVRGVRRVYADLESGALRVVSD